MRYHETNLNVEVFRVLRVFVESRESEHTLRTALPIKQTDSQRGSSSEQLREEGKQIPHNMDIGKINHAALISAIIVDE